MGGMKRGGHSVGAGKRKSEGLCWERYFDDLDLSTRTQKTDKASSNVGPTSCAFLVPFRSSLPHVYHFALLPMFITYTHLFFLLLLISLVLISSNTFSVLHQNTFFFGTKFCIKIPNYPFHNFYVPYVTPHI